MCGSTASLWCSTANYRGRVDIAGIDIPVWIPILLGVPFVLFAVVLVGIIRHTRRNLKVMRDAGVDDPMTAGGQIAARLATEGFGGGRAAATASKEQRLNELDDLHARGVIDDDEYRTARGQVLGG